MTARVATLLESVKTFKAEIRWHFKFHLLLPFTQELATQYGKLYAVRQHAGQWHKGRAMLELVMQVTVMWHFLIINLVLLLKVKIVLAIINLDNK